jgi:hypothetical protein
MPVAFGEWRPDVSDINGAHIRTAENVYPRGDGYGPVKTTTAFSEGLGDQCRGGFVAIDDDATAAVFAGTGNALHKLNNTDQSWDDVSLSAYSLATFDNWEFAQFGLHTLATNQNNALQVYTLGSSANFANVAGSPPRASHITVVNEFVVLSGLLNDPYRIQWSSRSDITGWTPTVNESDFQDFGDGGIVKGVAGGEFGYIFQDRAIRRMTYAPGSPIIFAIDRITEDIGLKVSSSLIRAGNSIFFLSAAGFYQIDGGGMLNPIGREKFDRTFFEDWDDSRPNLMIGANDPNSTRVMWCYRSLNSEADENLFDRILIYDYLLQRPSLITGITGQFITAAAEPGITLEGLDALGLGLEDLPQSLDDYVAQFGVRLSVFDSSGRLAFLTGNNLQARLETPEFGGVRRTFVRGCAPITDAESVEAEVITRKRAGAEESTSSVSRMNRNGYCPMRKDARFYRFRTTIPAGEEWSFISALEPDVVQTGAL